MGQRTEVEEKIDRVARSHGSVKRGKRGGAPLRPPVRGGIKRQMFKELKLCCLNFIRFLLGSVKRGKRGGAPLRPPVRGGVKRQMFKELKLSSLNFIRFLLCNNTKDVSD
ncbi:hypothetical protein U1Q18_037239 [Sarracenia purpurea var. burkii]